MSDPIADRRQRALEAYNDAIVEMYNDIDLGTNSRFELAIEVATQVKITDDIVNAARRASTIGFETPSGIEAAFRAAGFEVVE